VIVGRSEGEEGNEHWIVLRNNPVSQSSLLRSVLSSRFPNCEFEFKRFQERSIAKLSTVLKKKKPLGILIELKKLDEAQLPVFDSLHRASGTCQKILVLSPESYRLLHKRRRKKLHLCTLLLSEMKSLDYISQLPRLMDQVGVRQALQVKNERLQSLVGQQSWDDADSHYQQLPAGFPDRLASPDEEHRGIKVTVKRWTTLKESIGHFAAQELMSSLSRTLSQAVRGSDRILRSQENEFVVFLAGINEQQLHRCLERINQALDCIQLVQNQTKKNLPFQVTQLDHLPFSS